MPTFIEDLKEWVTRDLNNLGFTLGICLLGFVFSGYLAFVEPGQAAAAAISQADKTIQIQKDAVTTIQTELDAQMKWYKPTYVEGLQDVLNIAQDPQHLGKASATIDSARRAFWADDKIRLARQADKIAGDPESGSSVANLIAGVKKTLDDNIALRQNTRGAFVSVGNNLPIASQNYQAALDRYNAEAGDHLLKYTIPLTQSLTSANQNLTAVQAALTNALTLLPGDSDQTQSGDPRGALEQLNKAKADIDEVNTLMSQVTSTLDQLKEAKTQARPATDAALTKNVITWGHISNIVSARGFSLNKALAAANSLYEQAVTAQGNAETILKSPIAKEGGKIDYPTAYAEAKRASFLAEQAVAEADNQVTLADSAASKIGQITSRTATVNNLISQASTSLLTLQAYHASATWSAVSGRTTAAQNHVASAYSYKTSATSLSSLDQQKFAEANNQADSGLLELSQAESLANDVISLVKVLEQYRASWPGAEQAAQDTINAQTGNINTYGGDASAEVNRYHQAKTKLDEARGDARSWYYQNAVTKAQDAQSLASGTGQRAYDAYQARTARETEVAYSATQAEKDRQDAAAAAAAAAASSSSSSSNGGGFYDSGGSSSSSSSGGFYDSGGSSSGFDTSGGGYDSGGGNDGGGFSDSGGSGGSDPGGW